MNKVQQFLSFEQNVCNTMFKEKEEKESIEISN